MRRIGPCRLDGVKRYGEYGNECHDDTRKRKYPPRHGYPTPDYSLLATTRFAKSPSEPFPTQMPILFVVLSLSFSTTMLGLEAPLTETDSERSTTSMRPC